MHVRQDRRAERFVLVARANARPLPRPVFVLQLCQHQAASAENADCVVPEIVASLEPVCVHVPVSAEESPREQVPTLSFAGRCAEWKEPGVLVKHRSSQLDTYDVRS
jgi:hypothetical protein